MAVSYSSWSIERLKKERQKIDKAIMVAEKRDKKTTLAKMATIARQNGFELHELLSESGIAGKAVSKNRTVRKTNKPRGKVAPKYRNPAEHTQTWTGRGRQPLWVKEQLASGVAIEDLRITAAAE